MLGLVLLFLILAIVTGILGFGAFFAAGVAIGKALFWIFVVLLVISLIAHLFTGYRRGPVV